jgi:hypothetical protein
MDQRPSLDDQSFEDAARIVESFSAGKDDQTVALFEEVAAAIREKAIDD